MAPRVSFPPPQLTDEQLTEILALLGDADSAELKLTVSDEQRSGTADALGIDPLDAFLRQVFFFDTPDLDLDAAGLVVRARRSQGDVDDTVIKLRPVVPEELPSDLRKRDEFVVEVDAMPGGFVCSGSFKGKLEKQHVRAAIAGERPVRKLFSKAQREFYTANAPAGLGLDDLSILGPVYVLKLKFAPAELKRRMVAEMWLYPDGSRILELSTKCKPRAMFQVSAEARAYLADRGIDLSGDQQTKTRTALDYFSGQLQ